MAYATISQSDDFTLNGSSSPALPELQHTSLSLAFDELTDVLFADNYERPTEPQSKVGGIIKSLTSSSRHSYDLVEEDDYDAPQETPTVNKTMADLMQSGMSHTSKEDMPVRTASVSRHTPLNHPTPDLQSLQGAYLKNVERLEDSAERLSMASSLEHELGRMKEEIRRSESLRRTTSKSDRRYSSTSISNSIIGVNATARSGGYSPAGFINSPVGSVKSTHRTGSKRQSRLSKSSRFSQSLPEPEQEGKPLDSPMAVSPPVEHAIASPQSSVPDVASEEEQEEKKEEEKEEKKEEKDEKKGEAEEEGEKKGEGEEEDEEDRPGTAASNDTYHQAQNLFNDFDGTHFSPIRDSKSSRRVSMNALARDSRSSKQSYPSEDMIYYPAPVPVMLNLPSRLSRGDWGQRDKKRMQALKVIEGETRKSTTTWIADADSEPERQRPSTQLPPQLRASAFFDKPGSQQDVQLKNGSAVATLDSILDAAAFAPVSAFTDHPIAGHLGDEVYGPSARKSTQNSRDKKPKRRTSFGNMLGRKGTDGENAHDDDDHEGDAEKSMKPDDDELENGEQDGEDDEDESDDGKSHQLGFLGAPTTLLAELQLRKEQQRQRNRTAADAFPGGMHSTLLELDAVAQLQQKSRKTKHVTLAWEDHDVAEQQNFDDEDVPLGVLFPEKERQNHVNINRPLGLMEKKELEENEPLSSRRARLLGVGHSSSQMSLPANPPVEEPAPTINVPILQTEEQLEEEEDEEETLAQRVQRMKQKKENRASFADDVKSSLGLEVEESAPPKETEAEETLGKRRKRLREEAIRSGRLATGLRAQVSMADLLRLNPAGKNQNFNQSSLSLNSNNNRQDNIPLSQLRKEQSSMNLGNGGMPKQPLLGYQFQEGPTPYLKNGMSLNRFSSYANGLQGVNMMNAMDMGGMGVHNPYSSGMNPGMAMPQYGMAAQQYGMPMGGMGAMEPPLDPQQRAKIDAWRQGIV